MLIVKLVLLLFIDKCVKVVADNFYEDLVVSNLDDGSIYSLFQFTTNLEKNIYEEELSSHYNLFPKSFGEIVSKFQLAELHLSFTQGRWRYNKWGYPIFSAPTGVELWVWFLPHISESSVDRNWKGLVHALSGQFCSSLNFITSAETTKPKLGFKPLGVWPSKNISETHLRYAALSKETVCTENLSPWKKLLPCIDKAGLSTLLNPFRLFDSSYMSLAMHLYSTCQEDDCSNVSLELKQTVSSVVDPVRYSLQNGWSFASLYGSRLESTCPLASASVVLVNSNPNNVNEFAISPSPVDTKTIDGKKYSIYKSPTMAPGEVFDISTNYKFIRKNTNEQFILAHKYVSGYGQEQVGSICNINNNHPSRDITITYMDVLPYFVRTYFHTLRVQIGNEIVRPELVKFTPAYNRDRPALLEIRLTIPPQTGASISVEFEKVFLDWTDHPPDSHHGYYIGSSVITGHMPSSNYTKLNEQCPTLERRNSACSRLTTTDQVFRRIYTEPLLILMPLPDFSMPYNVICLTCTIIAIVFGSIYNATTRTFQVEDLSEKKTLLQKFTNFLSKLKKKEKQS